MTISRPVAGDNARPARIIGYDRLIPLLVRLVDHRHVCAHRWGEGGHHQADVAACRTPGPAFTLPMVRLSAHPISEDIVRTRSIWIRG